MTTLRQSIETYIHAKDGNRPHLMPRAFAADATLAMDVKTGEISFPGIVKGVDAISAILVSQFAQRYENVYTLCIGAPPNDDALFRCNWLVCMTEKASGAVRVGYGRYEWISQDGSGQISTLHITIEAMNTLPRESTRPVFDWVTVLPYPWCPSDWPTRSVPDIQAVQHVARQVSGCP